VIHVMVTIVVVRIVCERSRDDGNNDEDGS